MTSFKDEFKSYLIELAQYHEWTRVMAIKLQYFDVVTNAWMITGFIDFLLKRFDRIEEDVEDIKKKNRMLYI